MHLKLISMFGQDAFYRNMDPRRRQEFKDSQMIQENPNATANLPQKAIHREFNVDSFFRPAPFDKMVDDEIDRD